MIGRRGVVRRGMGQNPVSYPTVSAIPEPALPSLSTEMWNWSQIATTLPGITPANVQQEALSHAQQFCSTNPSVDCSNMDAVVAPYAAAAQAAEDQVPAGWFQIQPSSQPGLCLYEGIPTACPPGYTPPVSAPAPPGPTYSTNPAAAAAAAAAPYNPPPSTPAPPAAVVTAPVVVNPSPATQTTTDGSGASPTSVTSIANGMSVATSTDILAGVPNPVLFLGAGAAVLILMFAMSGGR